MSQERRYILGDSSRYRKKQEILLREAGLTRLGYPNLGLDEGFSRGAFGESAGCDDDFGGAEVEEVYCCGKAEP